VCPFCNRKVEKRPTRLHPTKAKSEVDGFNGARPKHETRGSQNRRKADGVLPGLWLKFGAA
jgi:hypothetical protein